MNGFKRASRRQAAVVGLAVLIGTSLLGCHAGPRLFSKKDRADRADKRELAEKDKGKFINRKKVRPESDYRDDTDEQVATSDSKSKSKSADAARKRSNDATERALAARQKPEDATNSVSRSTKNAANQPKTSKSADRADIARRDASRLPVTDLLTEDSPFESKLPESRVTANAPATTDRPAKSTIAKAKSLEEDPFKNSVIGPATTKRPEKKVAPVNFFDDEDLASEMAEELEELRIPATQNNIAKTAAAPSSINRRASPSAIPNQRKFLDEVDQPADGSYRSLLRDEGPDDAGDEAINLTEVRKENPSSESAKTVGGQRVIDRRQEVRQTLDDWRREIDRDESLATSNVDAAAPAPPNAARSDSLPVAKGHLSPAAIDEFNPPAKSQGAVLNGELIIDTKNLPAPFQRSTERSNLSGASGRMNSNSGANIDIVPGASQKRPRPAGQISLQSLSDEVTGTGLTTAGFEQPNGSSDLTKLPALKLDADAEAGPKLTALEGDSQVAPAPPEESLGNPTGIGLDESSRGARAWKRTLVVFAAMASAVMIGFGLRRRMELTAEPVRVPSLPKNEPDGPDTWPRG